MPPRTSRTSRATSLSVLVASGVVSLSIGTQGCSSAPEPGGASAGTGAAEGIPSARPIQVMKWRSPEERLAAATRTGSVQNTSAPSGAKLTYYGGRVVSNVQVVQVLWGTGTYLAQVTSTATPSVATFYQQATNSAYIDWLAEYDTTTTAQKIGRGAFVGQYAITPSVGGNLSDTQIQTELAAQIVAGHLPAPTHDATGNNNTYYAIYFPHGITISQGGSNSCQAGGFCAYHGTIASVTGFGEVYYGVHPDMEAGSGCDTGCGSAGSAFGNQTSVASHELVETITDAEVGLATVVGAPLAWYDTTNGEIGDICNAQQATFLGADGQTYTVQTEFSNVANNCIASRGAVTPDFSVSGSVASLDLVASSQGTDTITTAATQGSPEAVALSASGQPAGVTVTFAPTSVLAGASSTMTVATASSVAQGTYPITITGTASSGAHTTTLSLVVGHSLLNGGFETGTLQYWTASGASETATSTGCVFGTYCAELGSSTATSGSSSISQKFIVPAGKTSLSFWYKMTCPDTVTNDWAVATLKDDGTLTTTTLLPRTCATGVWAKVTTAVTAGHQYTLILLSHDDNNAANPTFTKFDGVALN